MSRRRSRGAAAGLGAVYEGPEALSALLERAGSPHAAGEVAAAFARAQAAGEPRSAVIPALFPEEPRFASPDEARRLYGNLFALWDRLAAGLGPHDDAPEVVPEPPAPPPLPERGVTPGRELPAELVESVWKYLAVAPPREVARRRDRYQNAQPGLQAWLDDAALPEPGGSAAADLVFEAWAMFDQAFGEQLSAVEWKALRKLALEPPPLSRQPALEAYAAEALDTLADEDRAFDEAARAQVEKVVATAVAGLMEALREPS